MPTAAVPPPETAQSCDHSEPIPNLEQPEKPQEQEVRSTSEQQVTPPQVPESKDNSQSIENSIPQNLEQPQEEVRGTSEQELTPSSLLDSSDTGQNLEPPAPSPEPLQKTEEQEVQANEERINPEKRYPRSPRMRLPKFVDS